MAESRLWRWFYGHVRMQHRRYRESYMEYGVSFLRVCIADGECRDGVGKDRFLLISAKKLPYSYDVSAKRLTCQG